jgi:hypothetical protein
VSTGPSNRRRHMGVEFLVWRREGTWFWFLINPRTADAMIGATANEARAISEACLSIEAIRTVFSPRSLEKRLPNKRILLFG